MSLIIAPNKGLRALLTALVALSTANCTTLESELASAQAPEGTFVVLETSLGDIRLLVHEDKAPISSRNFLAYVEKGLFDGASFYRRTSRDDSVAPKAFALVQGGLLGEKIPTLSGDEMMAMTSPLPPIGHETTSETGLSNRRGTVAFARGAPGTAASEFFINVTDNPMLDTGAAVAGSDGQGFATFAQVVEGMDVVDQIGELPASKSVKIELFKGTILSDPVLIERAFVVPGRR